jgi:hypothetical protein
VILPHGAKQTTLLWWINKIKKKHNKKKTDIPIKLQGLKAFVVHMYNVVLSSPNIKVNDSMLNAHWEEWLYIEREREREREREKERGENRERENRERERERERERKREREIEREKEK